MRNPLFSILCSCRASESKSKKIKHPTTKGNGKPSFPEHLYRRFSLDENRAATDNFDSNLVLGKGGSGVVYKGFFDDGASVLAVKRLMGSSILEDFRNEVQLLCQLRHQYLVSLIGFSDAGDEKIVVVDYMTQGSLFDHLHGIRQVDPLTWKQRLEICIGAARGLHYLHAGAKRAVIHRDIKSSNILLDDRMVSKIADFALSKIGPFSLSNAPIRVELPSPEDMDVDTSRTRIFGTLGYLAPEFLHEATPTLVTDKSDVFSFGVVLLEVISDRKVIKFDVMDAATRYIIPWVKEHMKNGSVHQIIDPFLKGKLAPRCLEKFLEIALSCIHFLEHKRPALGEVEAALELALELQNRADSEMECCLNPHGGVVYQDVDFPASACDCVADVFWPHGSSGLDSFKVKDSFSWETEDTISEN
ncbi:hypothetical protein F3Y22_tig00110926pilonHSYRG00111 [Hibiscus syriacus]|uniref:non-specific serine/threonine protein kinase n=1 Tax=Hibiscus syriacus TaxID=106335 RepID=A0A6A2ZFK3_HIBSY|nr:putative receptor-like protein kinase At5g39000 [Hibiscus syriacus]KAE8690129.1 hypothetical protein F3Y22_tig00110926pilonHSYRG00111 [Hibiscus syriacus]